MRGLCLRAAFDAACVVVEADLDAVLRGRHGDDLRGAKPESVLGAALHITLRYGVPVFWCGSRQAARAFTDKATTRELGRKLERLVAARVAGREPDEELRRWLEHIPAALHKRLVNYGLIDAACAEAARPLMIATLQKRKFYWRNGPE